MTQAEIEKEAQGWVAGRVQLSGEDEAPNISSSIDKELKIAFIAGAEWAEESRWISSENSLPRNGEMVLIPMRVGATAAEFNLDSQGKPFWIVWDCPGCIDAERTISLVKHWMPMPDCPILRAKEEKEQEK